MPIKPFAWHEACPIKDMDIFQYDNYRSFLKDYYTAQKQNNPAFSFRFFAKKAGLPSFNYLKLVMDGKRNLTSDYLKRFMRGLKLKNSKAKYFEHMVHLNQTKDASLKSEYLNKMLKLKYRVEAKPIEKEQSEIYSRWYHWVIREMTLLGDFKEDPKWISERLHGAITPGQAKDSLELLKKLKLIQKEDQKWVPSERAIVSSDEVSNLALKKMHESFLNIAIHKLFQVHASQREFAGVTIAIDAAKLSKIKSKIKKFRRELNESLSDEENANQVYQFSMQFYPLTQGGI